MPDSQNTQLATLEAASGFLADAFEDGDVQRIRAALAAVAQAPSFAELAGAAGVPRDALRVAFESGELSLDWTLAIMKVIDLHAGPR